jgi:hypothetical protein
MVRGRISLQLSTRIIARMRQQRSLDFPPNDRLMLHYQVHQIKVRGDHHQVVSRP